MHYIFIEENWCWSPLGLKGLNLSSVFKEDKRQEVGADESGVSLGSARYHLSEYIVCVTK